MSETRQERRMRQGREAVEAARKSRDQQAAVDEESVDAGPAVRQAPTPPSVTVSSAAPATSTRAPVVDDDEDPHEIRTGQMYTEVGGPIRFRGDRATREMKKAIDPHFNYSVYWAIWSSARPMTADEVWAGRSLQLPIEDRHPFMRDASLPRVQSVCRLLTATGWLVRTPGDAERFEAVRPKPITNESEAFDEVLALVDGSDGGEALRPRITEILSRVNREIDPLSPRAADALAELDSSWPPFDRFVRARKAA